MGDAHSLGGFTRFDSFRTVITLYVFAEKTSLRFSQRLLGDHAVFEMDEDECGFGDVADSAGAEGDVLEGAPALGEQGEAAFAEAA